MLGIAFAFGLAVTAMAYGVGPISGCHINPAVTLAMTTAGRLPVRELPGYIIAQLLGAIAGAAVPVVILSSKLTGYDLAASGLGQNGWGEGYLSGYGLLGALVTEFVATFIFVYVILAATNPTVNLQVAGLIIGLTLFALHFPFINVTGSRTRPAAWGRPFLWAERRLRRSGCSWSCPRWRALAPDCCSGKTLRARGVRSAPLRNRVQPRGYAKLQPALRREGDMEQCARENFRTSTVSCRRAASCCGPIPATDPWDRCSEPPQWQASRMIALLRTSACTVPIRVR